MDKDPAKDQPKHKLLRPGGVSREIKGRKTEGKKEMQTKRTEICTCWFWLRWGTVGQSLCYKNQQHKHE